MTQLKIHRVKGLPLISTLGLKEKPTLKPSGPGSKSKPVSLNPTTSNSKPSSVFLVQFHSVASNGGFKI